MLLDDGGLERQEQEHIMRIGFLGEIRAHKPVCRMQIQVCSWITGTPEVNFPIASEIELGVDAMKVIYSLTAKVLQRIGRI